MKETDEQKFNEIIERLMKYSVENGHIGVMFAANHLRKMPGMTDVEKIAVVKNRVLESLAYQEEDQALVEKIKKINDIDRIVWLLTDYGKDLYALNILTTGFAQLETISDFLEHIVKYSKIKSGLQHVSYTRAMENLLGTVCLTNDEKVAIIREQTVRSLTDNKAERSLAEKIKTINDIDKIIDLLIDSRQEYYALQMLCKGLAKQETILRFLQHLNDVSRMFGSGANSDILKIVNLANNKNRKKAVELAVNWAVSTYAFDAAVQISALRNVPGLRQHEIKSFLKYFKEHGSIPGFVEASEFIGHKITKEEIEKMTGKYINWSERINKGMKEEKIKIREKWKK